MMDEKTSCSHCNYIGTPFYSYPGNPKLETLLWFTGIFGFIYYLWRKYNRVAECSNCHAKQLKPVFDPDIQAVLVESI